MTQLSRRRLIGALLAAPVIIRTPGLLMPIKAQEGWMLYEGTFERPPLVKEMLWPSVLAWQKHEFATGGLARFYTSLYQKYSVDGPWATLTTLEKRA